MTLAQSENPIARALRDWDDHLGRRLRLRDLHILSNIAQWGSMAKAAKHLGISQPAVSEAIAQLEETLGVRLLDRNPRGIRPTIYGDALLRRGLVFFDELKQGIKEIEVFGRSWHGGGADRVPGVSGRRRRSSFH